MCLLDLLKVIQTLKICSAAAFDFKLSCDPENQVVSSINAVSGIVLLSSICEGWLISLD